MLDYIQHQDATRLQQLLRGLGSYEHVYVRARGKHLNIEIADQEQARDIVARATKIGTTEYGLSFRNHSGRWETLPVTGTLEEVARGTTELLGAYLDADNL